MTCTSTRIPVPAWECTLRAGRRLQIAFQAAHLSLAFGLGWVLRGYKLCHMVRTSSMGKGGQRLGIHMQPHSRSGTPSLLLGTKLSVLWSSMATNTLFLTPTMHQGV